MKYLVILSYQQDHTQPNLDTGDDDRWTTTETEVLAEYSNTLDGFLEAQNFIHNYEFKHDLFGAVNESSFIYIAQGKTAKGLNTYADVKERLKKQITKK